MIQFGGNIKFPGNSGEVQALQNSTTLRASTSGDVIVGNPHALRPEVDVGQDLGASFLRWRNLHAEEINSMPVDNLRPVDARAVSGDIIPNGEYSHKVGNDESPFESMAFGSGLQIRALAAPTTPDSEGIHLAHEIRCSGHFTPGDVEGGFSSSAFELGLPARRWNNVYAFSGSMAIVLETPRLNVNDIASFGGFDISVFTGLLPVDDNSYNLGNPLGRWKEIYAVSGVFSQRPSVLTSGVALRNEIYWNHTLGHVDVGATVSLADFSESHDSLLNTVYPVPIPRRCKLHSDFAVTTAHANATAPGMWVLLLWKNQLPVSSGAFSWSTTGAVQMTAGQWSDPVSFEPGDNYSILAHNDGSGTQINITVAKANLGFELDMPE